MKKEVISLINQNSEQTAAYLRQIELMVHDMFMNKAWDSLPHRKKSERVLSYCLHSKFITPHQLIVTGISISQDIKVERTFLDRLCKRGLLAKRIVDMAGINHIVYTITGKGAGWTASRLSALFLSHPELNAANIDESCLEYIRERARKYSYHAANAHAIAIRELNAFLLSYLPSPDYRYQIEALVNLSGDVYSHKRRTAGDITRMPFSLESDALLSVPIHHHKFYIEQDMNTQRPGIVKGKINNYIANVIRHTDKPWEHNVLLSLMTRTTRREHVRTANEYTHTSYFYIKAICFIIHMLATDMDFYEVPMKEVASELEAYIEYAPESVKFYKSTLKFLQNHLESSSDLTARDFLDLTREAEREHHMRNSSLEIRKQHHIAYKHRRQSLYNAIMKIPGIGDAMLKGFSIFASHTRNHEGIFPYLCPALSPQKEERLSTLLSYYHLVNTDDAFQYESAGRITSDIILKNHYDFGNFHVFVENISDDLGGKCRTEHYLEKPDCAFGNGILICLIEDDEIETAKSLFMDSTYQKFLHGETTAALPLMVCFIAYSSFDRGKGLFSFDKNGIYEAVGEIKKFSI